MDGASPGVLNFSNNELLNATSAGLARLGSLDIAEVMFHSGQRCRKGIRESRPDCPEAAFSTAAERSDVPARGREDFVVGVDDGPMARQASISGIKTAKRDCAGSSAANGRVP